MKEETEKFQCKQCKYFINNDLSLKTPLPYCILLGKNLYRGENCPEYVFKSKTGDITGMIQDLNPV